MGNITVKLPRIRLYFSYSVLCYLTTTNTTVILQNLFWVYITTFAWFVTCTDDLSTIDHCHMTMTTSGQIRSSPVTLRQNGNVNIKLWALCESLIVYILISIFQGVHMALSVNIPDVRRFISVEPADWIHLMLACKYNLIINISIWHGHLCYKCNTCVAF